MSFSQMLIISTDTILILTIKALVELDKCLNENIKKVAKANVSL